MTVKEIVEKYLKDNNYDGFYNGEDCGCTIEGDDIMDCCSDCMPDCIPGYKAICNNKECEYYGVIMCGAKDAKCECQLD